MKRELHRRVFVQLAISVCHANAKHPKSRPTKTPRSHPNLLPQRPRSASVRARRGGSQTAPAALSLRMTGARAAWVTPRCFSPALVREHTLGAFTNGGNLEARRSMWKPSPACGGKEGGIAPSRECTPYLDSTGNLRIIPVWPIVQIVGMPGDQENLVAQSRVHILTQSPPHPGRGR